MAAVAGYALVACLLAAGAFWLGAQADNVLGVGPAVAMAQDAGNPAVSDRAARINGQTVGEVLVDGDVVIRMRTSAGGISAPERAMIVAQRIQNWMTGAYSPYDLAIRQGPGGSAQLRAQGNLIVDVNPAEANALGSTSMGLANAWRSNIQMALGVQPVPAPGAATPVTGDTEIAQLEGVDPEPRLRPGYSDKIVPIFSLGRGARIGAARVNGPRDAVARVQGVTQFETRFRDFLVIDIYVPVTTQGGLDRVQRVGLTAIGDLGI